MRFEDYIIEVNRTRRLFNEVLSTNNLTGNKWIVMDYIYNHEDVTAKDIQEEFFMNKTTVSQILREMIKHDLINTVRNEKDGRSKILTLTENGLEKRKFLNWLRDEIVSVIGDEHVEMQTLAMVETREALMKAYEKLDK